MTVPDKPALRPITPEQMLQARVALGWSAERLAARSGTTAHIINRYEKLGQVASKRGQICGFNALAAILSAIKAAGVEFIGENGGGAGVRLWKPGAAPNAE